MSIRSNPHTHTVYSDGQATAEEMIRRAIALGFRSIGFTDHSVQHFDNFFPIPASREAEYRRELRALGEKYADRIRVYVSVELDAYAGVADRSQYDYILLSGHYVARGERRALVDSREHREELFSMRRVEFGGDGAALAANYFDMLGDAAARIRPDIVGHFDLIKVFNGGGALYDDGAPDVVRAKRDALSKIFASGALLEVNTGGLARGRVDEPYPAPAILQMWREMGGRVILGSDSHHPDTLDFGFDDMCKLLKGVGFSSAWELGSAGEALFVERAL